MIENPLIKKITITIAIIFISIIALFGINLVVETATNTQYIPFLFYKEYNNQTIVVADLNTYIQNLTFNTKYITETINDIPALPTIEIEGTIKDLINVTIFLVNLIIFIINILMSLGKFIVIVINAILSILSLSNINKTIIVNNIEYNIEPFALNKLCNYIINFPLINYIPSI